MKATTSSSRLNIFNRLALIALGVLIALLIFALVLAADDVAGFHAQAKIDGALTLPGLSAPVEIIRDARDIPHIRAQNEHDLFVAQGFAEGSDRLFQMDLTRHFVYGRLSEWFGSAVINVDERQRIVPVADIITREFAKLTAPQRAELQAFADGVNAAEVQQPMPFEYRLLFLQPQPWHAQDSLAVGFATVLNLADSYKDVLDRDAWYRAGGLKALSQQFPFSDPKYDVPIVGSIHRDPKAREAANWSPAPERNIPGSNQWATGAARNATKRALLANDPHLDLSIPGIWYLVDLRAPHFHAAGGSLAGTPGVILGHNEHVAWGATNGTVAAVSVFHVRDEPKSAKVEETFAVRFGPQIHKVYYRDAGGFYVDRNAWFEKVVWSAYTKARSPLIAFDGLDRSASIEDAMRALSQYPGPTQNFVLADRSGRAAYTLAGLIPNDPVWALHSHPQSERAREFPDIPFAALPHVAASISAEVFTANNRMFGDGYPYRLSATFTPPYRAYRIKQLLDARKKYDVDYFWKMQSDTLSIAELEYAKNILISARKHPKLVPAAQRKLVDALSGWDGRFDGGSIGATAIHALRVAAHPYEPRAPFATVLHQSRAAGMPDFADAKADERPWRIAGAIPILNPLDNFGIPWLNGATLPGDGDAYTVHVQNGTLSQSFRAVWDVGNWDAGGMIIPAGESGQPGSPYYQNLTLSWIAQKLQPLPFSDRAIDAQKTATLTLQPK